MSRTNHNRKPKGKKLKSFKTMVSLANTTRPCMNKIFIDEDIFIISSSDSVEKVKKILFEYEAKYSFYINIDSSTDSNGYVSVMEILYSAHNDKRGAKIFKNLKSKLANFIIDKGTYHCFRNNIISRI